MDAIQKLESEAMKRQVLQQIRLLQAKGALKILQHVPGRAAMVSFVYADDFFGQVVIKGEKYKMFKEAGGFGGTALKDAVNLEGDDEGNDAEVSGGATPPNAAPPAKPEPKTEAVTPESGNNGAVKPSG